MKLSLTRSEMLERRRLVGGLEPLRTDCSVSHADGIDIDALLEIQLREWYVALLDTAPVGMLAPEDIAGQCSIEIGSGPWEGGAMITVPDSCRRPLSVFLQGWMVPAAIQRTDQTDTVLCRQLNPYTAADETKPVAIVLHDGRIAAWPYGRRIGQLTAILDKGPGIYSFDEAALATIPKQL